MGWRTRRETVHSLPCTAYQTSEVGWSNQEKSAAIAITIHLYCSSAENCCLVCEMPRLHAKSEHFLCLPFSLLIATVVGTPQTLPGLSLFLYSLFLLGYVE